MDIGQQVGQKRREAGGRGGGIWLGEGGVTHISGGGVKVGSKYSTSERTSAQCDMQFPLQSSSTALRSGPVKCFELYFSSLQARS